MISIHGQEIPFANPVPQDAGVTGRQLILRYRCSALLIKLISELGAGP